MRLSLVIPCYNEAPNLTLLLERCKKLSVRQDIEVLFIDNGSIDNTTEILKSQLSKYSRYRSIRIEKNQGYGFGILAGLKEAKGEILGWTHADMQTDPQDVLSGLDKFDQHGDNIFIKGRRYGRPFMDVVFTCGMSIFETILLGQQMWDINAQPTIFPRSLFESWTNPPDDFALDLYAYYQAKISNLKVHRFPVSFGERAHGTSHWNINWQAKLKFIRRTVNFSLQLKKKISK